MRHIVSKIISGGQTGVDRAALDVARELRIPAGGWVPKGRTAEDGVIPAVYTNLVETDDAAPETRTRLNAGSADATLILKTANAESKGTNYTQRMTQDMKKPCLVIVLEDSEATISHASRKIREWLDREKPTVLNVAGPRAGEDASIYLLARRALTAALRDGRPAVPELVIPDAVLDRALNNMRHWDNIRWIVPFWYLSVAGASFLYLRQQDHQQDARLIAAAVLATGVSCIWLMFRTMLYHNIQGDNLIDTFAPGHHRRDSADVLLSMSFSGPGLLLRATTWFMIMMAAACVTAALVLWHGSIPAVIKELSSLQMRLGRGENEGGTHANDTPANSDPVP